MGLIFSCNCVWQTPYLQSRQSGQSKKDPTCCTHALSQTDLSSFLRETMRGLQTILCGAVFMSYTASALRVRMDTNLHETDPIPVGDQDQIGEKTQEQKPDCTLDTGFEKINATLRCSKLMHRKHLASKMHKRTARCSYASGRQMCMRQETPTCM